MVPPPEYLIIIYECERARIKAFIAKELRARLVLCCANKIYVVAICFFGNFEQKKNIYNDACVCVCV